MPPYRSRNHCSWIADVTYRRTKVDNYKLGLEVYSYDVHVQVVLLEFMGQYTFTVA